MTADEIKREIMAYNWTNDELDSIIDAVKFARSHLGKTQIRQLAPGKNVSFHSSKQGYVKGIVESIGTKYVIVSTARGNWRVPANLITLEN